MPRSIIAIDTETDPLLRMMISLLSICAGSCIAVSLYSVKQPWMRNVVYLAAFHPLNYEEKLSPTSLILFSFLFTQEIEQVDGDWPLK